VKCFFFFPEYVLIYIAIQNEAFPSTPLSALPLFNTRCRCKLTNQQSSSS